MSDQRRAAVIDRAREAGIDVLAVIPGPNLFHLTGLSFGLSERPVVAFLPNHGTPVIITPVLEEQKARSVPFDCEVIAYSDLEGPVDAFRQAREHLTLSGKRVGVEGRRCRFLELELIGDDVTITNADPIFASIRMAKDEAELACMRRAVAIAEEAFRQTLPRIRAGTTETELSSELTLQILRSGSEPELPFTAFASAGPNASNPHAVPGDRPLTPGDLVILDWGATSGGYASDITRTVAVAGAPVADELRRAYDVVLAANQAGREAARPGGTGEEVDRATRRVIEEADLGEYFTHRTGHGLGLECHEEPDMNEGSHIPLEVGMTFTVEPGVYIPGVGGVRIEDDVVITAEGSESLTSLPRELVVAGS